MFPSHDRGALIIRPSGSSSILAEMISGSGRTALSMYSVPTGSTLYIRNIFINVDSSKTANIKLYCRQNFDNITSSISPRFLLTNTFSGVSGYLYRELESYLIVPEKSDVWAEANVSTNNVPVEVSYDGALINSIVS